MHKGKITDWLPTSVKEAKARGWDELDVILFSGDAYVDHPSFGAAVIGRLLEAEGLRVAIIPQPNWQDDLRDFKKFGRPKLFFGVSGGSMDSMVNHYTANKRLRSDDAYTAGGKAGFRPDYAVTTYTKILKELFPHTPVVIGGIEASLRRTTHYDYWSDTLKPSILMESGADLLCYGMGDRVIVDVARAMQNGYNLNLLKQLRQVSFVVSAEEVEHFMGYEASARKGGGKKNDSTIGSKTGNGGGSGNEKSNDSDRNSGHKAGDTEYNMRIDAKVNTKTDTKNCAILLHSFEECCKSKKAFGENFIKIETESNRMEAQRLIEPTGSKFVVVNPPYPSLTEAELDRSFELPFTRLPHPRYNNRGAISAYEMIKFSVNMHRGCFGGCSFCTISAHQGKFISSRSENSILKEVRAITEMDDFKGYISDLGGPSANMYRMSGIDQERCKSCRRPSCIYPAVCKNLNNNHTPLISLYRKLSEVNGIKKAFIGSGIRYDMIPSDGGKYLREVIKNHVSGRLKVAPEHTEDGVLRLMRKPSFELFKGLNSQFNDICAEEGLKYQLIPYFISSHPGCSEGDMRELAMKTKRLNFRLEQVQDLTPTPMTLSSVMFYTGVDPYSGSKVYVARSQDDKRKQKGYFFK